MLCIRKLHLKLSLPILFIFFGLTFEILQLLLLLSYLCFQIFLLKLIFKSLSFTLSFELFNVGLMKRHLFFAKFSLALRLLLGLDGFKLIPSHFFLKGSFFLLNLYGSWLSGFCDILFCLVWSLLIDINKDLL